LAENNANEQTLNELRKLNRIMRQGYIISIVFMAAVILCIIVLPYYVGKMKPPQKEKEASLTWEKVIDLTDKGSYDEAEKIALNLLQKTPTDYYPHTCLAALYLRKGDLTQAMKYAEISYRLFPNKSNEETLQALKKRLELEGANKTKPEGGQ
jgi:tetratricopeptide (TPR) repeat protein